MNVLFSFKQVQTFLTILVMMIFSFLDASADTSSLLIKDLGEGHSSYPHQTMKIRTFSR